MSESVSSKKDDGTKMKHNSMKIPVFVSAPSCENLDADQICVYNKIVSEYLNKFHLEPRSLGKSDYPAGLPLREVLVIGKHCAGAIILGFEVFQAASIKWRSKKNENDPNKQKSRMIPSEWNNLEAGILFALGLPLLIFREGPKKHPKENPTHGEPEITPVSDRKPETTPVSGGVFDNGVTDAFVRMMPTKEELNGDNSEMQHVFLKWHARVSARYYGSART